MNCVHPDCEYWASGTETCDYYLWTGRRRGCPAGPDCAKYASATDPESKAARPICMSKNTCRQVESLYVRGMTDEEIADILGISRLNVTRWRKIRGLPANRPGV